MSYEQATAYMKMAAACKEEVLSIFRKLDMEYLKLLEQLEQAQERIAELEMKYENTGAVFNRQYMQEKIEQQQQEIRKLQQQLQQAQAKIERCKEILKDIREASSDIYALRKAEQALQALEGAK